MRLPVTLHLRPSRRLAIALIVAHGVAAGAVTAASAMPLVLRTAGVLALALSLAWYLRRHVWRLPFAALTLRADGELEALRADGSSTPLRVDAGTVVFSGLVVLRTCGAQRHALVLPSDALDRGGHRELRLWLRWKAALG